MTVAIPKLATGFCAHCVLWLVRFERSAVCGAPVKGPTNSDRPRQSRRSFKNQLRSLDCNVNQEVPVST